MKVLTKHDGWDCEPNFAEAVDTLSYIDHYVYEINHCTRATDIAEMKYEMIQILKEAIEHLEGVDDTIEWESVYED